VTETSELKIIITADDKSKEILAGNKKSLLDLGELAGGALKLGLAVGAAGVATLGAALFSSVGAAGESELALADLDATLKSTAAAFNQTADAIPHATDEAAAAIEKVSTEHTEGITKVTEEGTEKAADLSERVVELSENLAERQATIQGQMAEEADSFNDRMAESSRALNERLGEMVEAHAERVSSLQDQIAAGNDGFNDRMAESSRALNERLGEMVEAYAERVSGLQDQITGVTEGADERRRTQQERLQETIANIEERTVERREALQERLAETEDATQRVKLEAQLAKLDETAAKEKSKAEAKAAAEEERQKRADDKRLVQLQGRLNKENTEYAKQQAKLSADVERQEAKYKEEHDKKLAALKATLDKENAEYTKQQAKLRAGAARREAEYKEEHDKKLAAVKATLDRENAEYAKQSAKIRAEQTKVETETKVHLAKLEADYGEAMGKVAEKFSAIERGLVAPQRASQISRQAILDQADALQNLTRFEDDTIISGQSMLLTFTNIGANVFPQATEAILDMATKFKGMGVDSAAIMLGKALQDPITGVTALKRAGVMLNDTMMDQVKAFMDVGNIEGAQKIILKELQTELDKSAIAAGATLVGKLDILKNKFGDVQEKIGGGMVPGLTILGNKLIEVLDKPEVQAAIASLSIWLGTELPKAIEWGTKLLMDLQEGGLSGVLTKAKAWSEDPATKAFLQGIGSQVGTGIVEGVRITVTNAPIWIGLAAEMGNVAIPIITESAKAFGGAMFQSILEGMGLSKDLSAKLTPIIMAGAGAAGAAAAGPMGPVAGAAGAGAGMWEQLRNLLGFQSGGVVPGTLGAPRLAMVHGGETITPAGGSSGNLTFIYSPQMSLADEREIQSKLIPALDRWYADARRRRVVA
jgi:hypothetical protein